VRRLNVLRKLPSTLNTRPVHTIVLALGGSIQNEGRNQPCIARVTGHNSRRCKQSSVRSALATFQEVGPAVSLDTFGTGKATYGTKPVRVMELQAIIMRIQLKSPLFQQA
jgi:predicted signal transduction protein with EAL and GGDEF domain